EGRGRGVGEALMRECLRLAQESGAPGITLHTTEMMQAAMRLYERMGFVRVPELDLRPLPGVVAKGYRLLFMPTASCALDCRPLEFAILAAYGRGHASIRSDRESDYSHCGPSRAGLRFSRGDGRGPGQAQGIHNQDRPAAQHPRHSLRRRGLGRFR